MTNVAELAPTSSLGRSTSEMKKRGLDCVFLDISLGVTNYLATIFRIFMPAAWNSGSISRGIPIPVMPATLHLRRNR